MDKSKYVMGLLEFDLKWDFSTPTVNKDSNN